MSVFPHPGASRQDVLPITEFSIDSIIEADRSLMDRKVDGLTVTLWLVQSTSSMYVTVEDRKGINPGQTPETQRINVQADENPLDRKQGKYWHPFAHLPDQPKTPKDKFDQSSGLQDGQGER